MESNQELQLVCRSFEEWVDNFAANMWCNSWKRLWGFTQQTNEHVSLNLPIYFTLLWLYDSSSSTHVSCERPFPLIVPLWLVKLTLFQRLELDASWAKNHSIPAASSATLHDIPACGMNWHCNCVVESDPTNKDGSVGFDFSHEVNNHRSNRAFIQRGASCVCGCECVCVLDGNEVFTKRLPTFLLCK